MTMLHQKKMYHWMIMVGTKERVSATHLPQNNRRSVLEVPLTDILPNQNDKVHLRQEFSELIGRVLVSHLPCLSTFKDNLQWHMPHDYSSEMCKQSDITPLGLFDADEKSTADMIKILGYIDDRYVPYVPVEEDGEIIMKQAVKIIIAGDQLTKQNSDAALRSVENANTLHGQQSGIVPAIADFHCSMNFTDLILKEYYKTTSSADMGTLHQLRNLIDRRNVSTTALGDKYRASNTFIQDVTEAFIIAAAMHYFSMKTTQDTPKTHSPPATFQSDSQKRNWFNTHLRNIVDIYVMNDTMLMPDSVVEDEDTQAHTQAQHTPVKCHFHDCKDLVFKDNTQLKIHFERTHDIFVVYHGQLKPKPVESQASQNTDGVFNYHSGFLKLALLERDFQDSIKEGDGQRIVRLWKFKMLHFKQAGRNKYSLEALKLLLDIHALQSSSVGHRLMWNRTINAGGGAGNNIALDLNCEHFVRLTKDVMAKQGANMQFDIAQPMSRTIGELTHLMKNYDDDCEIQPESGHHPEPNKEADISKIIGVLQTYKVFSLTPGRRYTAFQNTTANPLHRLKLPEVVHWINEHKRKCHVKQVSQ